jgi:NADPH-dependent 2,4-dienoyl-CoA reductase/sulfur reductase-like enzyme
VRAERLVIIGGVAAGMSAASRARRLNPQMEVVVLEKGDYVSYGACGLAYFVSGVVPQAEDLVIYTPEYFRDQRGIYALTCHEALEILPAKKQVLVRRPDGETAPTDYDKLIITAGGAPDVEVPGADAPGVFRCNSLADAIALRAFLEERKPKRAVVIGGGYIGLEAAEALRRRGLEVSLLERSATLMEDLEPEIGQWVEERLRAHEVSAHLNSTVSAIDPAADGSLVVSYGQRQTLTADVAVVATGIVPRAELAARAEIELGASGAIRTDDRQQTNLPGIYAAGDCTETFHRVTGGAVYFPLGTTANKQGRVAGENAAGGNASFPGIVGTLVTKVFELEVAKSGLSWAGARAAGFQPEVVKVDSRSRARYLKGKPLRCTLVADRPSGRLLGAQLAGEEGAARRIDVVATALAAQMTVADFVHLDLGYAPPFGPVYDPLLVAAWQALKAIGRRR